MVRHNTLAAVVLGCAALAGCQENRQLPTHPVEGKLTLEGKPVAGAEIWLVPTSPEVKDAPMTIRPHAKSQPDGTFQFTSYVAGDGAPAGEYTVIVQKAGATDTDPEADPETPNPKAAKPKDRFPTKYGSPGLSKLSFTVKPGPNRLDLDLKLR